MNYPIYYINLKTAKILFKNFKNLSDDCIEHMYEHIIPRVFTLNRCNFVKVPKIIWDIKMIKYELYRCVRLRGLPLYIDISYDGIHPRLKNIKIACRNLNHHRKYPEDFETGILLEDLSWANIKTNLKYQKCNIHRCYVSSRSVAVSPHHRPRYYHIWHMKDRNKEYHKLRWKHDYKTQRMIH